jgi:ABC-type transporter Mla subunit MlaD
MLSLVRRPEFDGNLDEVASELSSLYRDSQDLETAADNLEALAASLRKIRSRRR